MTSSAQGLVATGTRLYFTGHGSVAFKEVANVKTTPEIGATPQQIEITNLDDVNQRYAMGMGNVPMLAFTVVYKGPDWNTIYALAGNGEEYDWKLVYPDGMYITFTGPFQIQLEPMDVNTAATYTLTIAPDNIPKFHKSDSDSESEESEGGDSGMSYRPMFVKTFDSVADMNSYDDAADDVIQGDFVLINSTDGDRGKVYFYNGDGFTFFANIIGPQGIKGDKGDPGLDMRMLGKEDALPALANEGSFCFVGTTLYSYTNSKWINLGDFKGDKGDKGDQGIQGEKGETGATGPTGPTGPKGETGDSAYTEAVAGGFKGTQEQWIASLKGDKGDSAYTQAVASGFKGSETDWLASLKGDKGEKGDPGEGLDIKGQVTSVSALPTTANEGDGYLVNEELYVHTNGAWKDCGPIQGPQGVQGPKGDTGTGISSTTIQYQISSSATTAPTGTWSDNIVATTDASPYLWMKAALNYTDGTTKDFYLVSQKGDKGDTGDIGPIGPQGPVGSGLVVKGSFNNASQLPTTGNQEGYCYFVGTDLYVWDAGAWKNCGNVSPDLSKYITVTDLNNGLNTKVTDNHDGTEQLNGVKVQPFNKLSDTIGGRNLVKDSEQEFTGKAYDFHDYNLASITELTPGKTYTVSFNTKVDDKAVNCKQRVFVDIYNPSWSFNIATFAPISTDYHRVTNTFTLPEGQTGINIITVYLDHPVINGNYDSSADKSSDAGTGYIKEFKLEQGSIATDWTPAPEDKVNVADMRKPASDVAGIEEVSAKQDKIGYTPADDSKVVHSTVTQLNSTDMNTVLTAGFYRIASGTNRMPNTDDWALYQVINLNTTNGVQLAYGTNNNTSGMRSWHTSWVNGNPVTTFSNWVQFADDSKVAHLSGANNFDTVPTVNNNPLLLASSLPSDLARTGSNQEFTGKNTFDTAPIDKTTGNPYITKDGVPAVPSTLADTTKDANFTGKLQKSGIDVATKSDVTTAVSTATANMVDSTKATNFTAGLQSGGVDVATAADLKSVEASAWRQLDNKYIIPASGHTLDKLTSILYKIDDSIHTLYLSGSIMLVNDSNDKVPVTIQLGSIVKSIVTYSVPYYGNHTNSDGSAGWNVVSSSSSTSLTINASVGTASISVSVSSAWNPGHLAYVTYDKLV